jgi:hypothetical protein
MKSNGSTPCWQGSVSFSYPELNQCGSHPRFQHRNFFPNNPMDSKWYFSLQPLALSCLCLPPPSHTCWMFPQPHPTWFYRRCRVHIMTLLIMQFPRAPCELTTSYQEVKHVWGKANYTERCTRVERNDRACMKAGISEDTEKLPIMFRKGIPWVHTTEVLRDKNVKTRICR